MFKKRKRQLESLEIRAYLSGDGVIPPDLADDPVDVAPPEPAPILMEADLGDFGNTPADANKTAFGFRL